MAATIRELGKPRPQQPAPWRRFRCSKCGAMKDQRVRNPEAKKITCVCGCREAIAIGEPTDTPAEFDWWVDSDGEYVYLDRRMMQTPLNRPLPIVVAILPLWKRVLRKLTRA